MLGSLAYPNAVEKCLCNLIQCCGTISHPALILTNLDSQCLYLSAFEKDYQRDKSRFGNEREELYLAMQREPKPEQMFLFDLGPPLKYEVRMKDFRSVT